jgi:hypothetical protein
MCTSVVVRTNHDLAFKLLNGSCFKVDCKVKLAMVGGKAGWLEGKHCSFSFEGLVKAVAVIRIAFLVDVRD